MAAGRSRHVPMRRCVVCRTVLPQSELIRFAKGEDGSWRMDPKRRAGGRGAWLCGRSECHRQKALGRAFRSQAADVAQQLAALRPHLEAHERGKASQDGGIDV